ncbi:hypothetical protein D9615_002629 [Tricholomella constricta]|uniref:Vps53 N-terminal domain-containing protein n=1 Tax=Tricholomella constricta TaxID=117010 RepID=A0A8H5M9N9_9AGAR|nr:hypothetical protein D9615_002629 [Tricholomella constricta]
MAKKGKDDAPTANSAANRDIIQRLNFLYQASVYLNTIPSTTPSTSQMSSGSSNANIISDKPNGRKKGKKEMKGANAVKRTATVNDLARTYIATMKTVGQRTTVKIDPAVKRTLCKGCNLTLIPGATASVRVKKSPAHGHIMVYTCTGCNTPRRIPAPPTLSAGNTRTETQTVIASGSEPAPSENSTAAANDAPMDVEPASEAGLTRAKGRGKRGMLYFVGMSGWWRKGTGMGSSSRSQEGLHSSDPQSIGDELEGIHEGLCSWMQNASLAIFVDFHGFVIDFWLDVEHIPLIAMHNDELPHEVILAIQRVLEIHDDDAGRDPFDALTLSTAFNPVPVLNDLFSDEASLAHLDTVSARLIETQRELQTEIDALQGELRRSQDPERVQLIQEMISDLLGQMSRIREKATESEAVVRNITKDIQVLDTAKKNLILSMTTLKRLQMLVNALTQLEDLVRDKKYSEVAQTLAAVKQISATFKSYTAVQRVAQVWKRIQETQGDLRNQIDADFDAFILQDTSKCVKAPQIADACLVVDVIGVDFRSHLIDRYVALELKEYRRIFRATDEAGQLDNISRRFAWFRRMLQTHEVEQGRVFPAEWKVGWYLLAKFVDITRDDLTMLLAKAGASLTVKALLDNLQITTEFEAAMSKKWATRFQAMLDATTGTHAVPLKPMSATFEPHMSIFVDAQDKVLADMLAPHRKLKSGKLPPPRPSLDAPGDPAEDDSPILVLPSSTDLFYFYAQSLEQCAKLSTGQALFDLCTLHKKWLRIYAEDVLIASLRRAPSQPQPRRSTDTRFDPQDLKHACMLINTADYCLTTALELEEKIREKVNEEFKERVSLQAERDMFVSVISAAIVIQLRELESACDAAFATMARTMWTASSQVSGQSAYAGELVTAAEQVIETVKPLVEQKKYLRNLFDKACSLILAKFTTAIVKSRPLKEIGAEQLLIDLQQVKGYLSKMPGEALMTASYTRGLTKSTTRLEALLKVIVTPVDPPEGFILNYTLLIGDASFSNFQKILDLKGTPKAQQNSLLDDFLTITSTKTDLDSTSFLSSLDMEPPGPGQLGGSLVSPGGSRVSLPQAVSGESIFATMTSPASVGPMFGSGASSNASSQGGSGMDTPTRGGERREVFSDFRRFVSFGLRKDSMAPS